MSPRSPDGRLHVAYVLKKYPRLSETFILNEILGLESGGVDVSVFSLRVPDEGRFQAELARVRGEVRYLPAEGSSTVLEAFRWASALPGATGAGLASALAFLDRLPAEKRATVLLQGLQLAGISLRDGVHHLHAHFVTAAAHTAYVAHLFSGIPFTVTAHAKDIYRETVDAVVFREIARAAAAVVTVCDANRRHITSRLLDGGGRVRLIYNGLPIEEVKSAPVPGDRRLILAAGRLVEKKGFHVLLEACRILVRRGVDFHCVILGAGEQEERLLRERRLLRLEDRVEMPGARPREEILRRMRGARVMAAPCVSGTDGNRDALPTVLLEALAVGLPVVSTPIGGIPEIVRHGAEGLLVPPNDPLALADAIARLLADDPLWNRFSRSAREKAAARFDRRKTLPDLIRLFRASVNPEARLAHVVA